MQGVGEEGTLSEKARVTLGLPWSHIYSWAAAWPLQCYVPAWHESWYCRSQDALKSDSTTQFDCFSTSGMLSRAITLGPKGPMHARIICWHIYSNNKFAPVAETHVGLVKRRSFPHHWEAAECLQMCWLVLTVNQNKNGWHYNLLADSCTEDNF